MLALDKVKYFIVLPDYEWTGIVLNKKARYTIDFFKNYVINKGFNFEENLVDEFNSHNYYKVLCLSECIHYSSLMNRKYQINYQRGGKNEN